MFLGHRSWCRQFATIGVRSAALVVGVLLASMWVDIAAAHDRQVSLQTADQLIDEACRAKTDGQPAVAYSLLHRAVHIAPDNSLARWQLGQIGRRESGRR
jgi:hypothetical protein